MTWHRLFIWFILYWNRTLLLCILLTLTSLVFKRTSTIFRSSWKKAAQKLKQQATQCILSISVISDVIIRKVPAQTFKSVWRYLGSNPKLYKSWKHQRWRALGPWEGALILWITAYRVLLSSVETAVSKYKYLGRSSFPTSTQGWAKNVSY